MTNKLITLTTDFGTKDSYVASMKGVIHTISPACTIIDITHEVEPQQILQGAIALGSAFEFFPPGTVHIAVVDPGVGTERHLLAVKANHQFFLAPDNGLLGIVFDRVPDSEVRIIKNQNLFLPHISRTFHGRDILSPVGAHLVEGVPLHDIGPVAKKYQSTIFPESKCEEQKLCGQIVYRDRFGNLMTNISIDELSRFSPASVVVRTGYTEINGLSEAYSDVTRGELLCLIGSAGYLEIALREGSAADKLRFPLGTTVEIDGELT